MSLWGNMRGLFLSDDERGKKDDDHKHAPRNGNLRQQTWAPARVPPRRFLKRILLVFGAAILTYLFIHNIPTDIGPRQSLRPSYGQAAPPGYPVRGRPPPNASPKQTSEEESVSSHEPPQRNYNAPPKFLELAATLRAIGATRGSLLVNRNVLFAASSLKSAAALLPVACQMGTELRNYVHFALMSRNEISTDDLLELNGIDESCHIIMHDARPEHAQISTDDRMESSVFRAFYHIHTYMHPQAIFIDASEQEERFFRQGARAQAKASGNTLVELPVDSAKDLMWLTKLDSSSLHMWDKIHIDILVHAIPGASGSLIRLLRSLSRTDFAAGTIPHLTIELPHDIDPPTKRFLETFKWPPAHVYNPNNARYLSLRHRIPHQRMTEEESSFRFLESFWPADPHTSHILVLSPQVELSPQFFHYLRYTLMEYRYSTASIVQNWGARLLGISLEQPLKMIGGNAKFVSPSIDKSGANSESTSFIWQAPTSSAMLFLGERWIELHDFVSRTLEARDSLDHTPALLSEKLVSTEHPSWLEYALKLSRLRGYWTVYPGEKTAKNLATVHRELHHLPEEYADVEPKDPALADDASEAEIDAAIEKYKGGVEISLAPPVSLLQSLPHDGVLSSFASLPLLSWDGQRTDVQGIDAHALEYSSVFKKEVGKCVGKAAEKEVVSLSTEDLFCETD
ncbi:uncharacterized protein PG986_005301 [Apiospora aurea]|uniref:Glycosyltransferase 2 n=1 Tax=Apiospora aurea TaxID=335848 RepID=A0ABR1QH54_9PEZI